ncbi:hypothetical protein BOV90_11725 [Solemya velum gill symbiont]|nr:hypothetical protein BOV90_11725 [Solemya velum gill symbiont]
MIMLLQLTGCGDSIQSSTAQQSSQAVISTTNEQSGQQTSVEEIPSVDEKPVISPSTPVQISLPGWSRESDNKKARPKENRDEWSEWRSMAAGFVARKRKMPETDTQQVLKRYASRDELKKNLKKGRSGKQAHLVKTSEAGLYKLTVPMLADLMGKRESKVRKLLSKGKYVKLGYQGDKAQWHYDAASDALYFVAQPYKSLFTTDNAFQLSQQGNGKFAMPQSGRKAGKPSLAVAPGTFTHTELIEQDNFSYPHLFKTADANYWVWKLVRDIAPFEESIQVTSPAESGVARMRIYLSGASDIQGGDDHRVTATFVSDGIEVEKFVTWDGFEKKIIELEIDQAALTSGNGKLHLTTELSGSWELLDRIEIDYQREMHADSNQLWMKGLEAGTHTVRGLSSANVYLVESPTDQPVWRSDLLVTPEGDGNYSATFKLTATSDVLVSADTAINEPLVTADVPSNLKSRNKRANYLIIAPRGLTDTANTLKAYRQGTHGKVKIVWLQDIYDEFSFGRADPQAIRDFLKYTKERWRKAPEFVALIGRGTADHTNIQGKLDSWVPLQMAVTPWGLASSDASYFDVDADGVNDFSAGRISVVTDEEGVAYVNKVKNYESLAFDGNWMRRVVLAADDPDSAGDFHADVATAAAHVSQLGYDSEAYYYPTNDIGAVLRDSTTWESSVVGYMGHGLTGRLDKFLKKEDVASFDNSKGQALFLPLTCSAGNSNYPGYKSLSETLVFPDQAELDASGRFLKGAIASVAPTGKSLNADAGVLATAFYNAALAEHRSLGDAVTVMQSQSVGQVNDFMLNIYWLLGDPALVLN